MKKKDPFKVLFDVPKFCIWNPLFILALVLAIPTYGATIIAWFIAYGLHRYIQAKDLQAIKEHLLQDRQGRKLLAILSCDDSRFKIKAIHDSPFPSWCKSVKEFRDPNNPLYSELHTYIINKLYPQPMDLVKADALHDRIIIGAAAFLRTSAYAEYYGFKTMMEQWDVSIYSFYITTPVNQNLSTGNDNSFLLKLLTPKHKEKK